MYQKVHARVYTGQGKKNKQQDLIKIHYKLVVELTIRWKRARDVRVF